MAVLDQGNSITFEQTLPTSSRSLKAAVNTFAGRKSVVFAQSTLAAWAYRVLERCADQVVVADALHNHGLIRAATFFAIIDTLHAMWRNGTPYRPRTG